MADNNNHLNHNGTDTKSQEPIVNGNGSDGDSHHNQSPQDVHTREKLFDFIALLQGRRMDDQRAILNPSNTT